VYPLDRHIYLASRSSRRRELLKQIGVSFELLLLREGSGREADFDETPLPDETPGDYVLRIARIKAEAGWMRLGQRRMVRAPVMSADTTVEIEGRALGKPGTREEAIEFLRLLSGKTHEVHTAVALKFDARIEVALSSTQVAFREVEEREIRQYVTSGEPMDKAGGYGIQGRAAVFIRSIAGSYSGVMGLPLFETGQLLAKFGYAII
jgi:septum formation protein